MLVDQLRSLVTTNSGHLGLLGCAAIAWLLAGLCFYRISGRPSAAKRLLLGVMGVASCLALLATLLFLRPTNYEVGLGSVAVLSLSLGIVHLAAKRPAKTPATTPAASERRREESPAAEPSPIAPAVVPRGISVVLLMVLIGAGALLAAGAASRQLSSQQGKLAEVRADLDRGTQAIQALREELAQTAGELARQRGRLALAATAADEAHRRLDTWLPEVTRQKQDLAQKEKRLEQVELSLRRESQTRERTDIELARAKSQLDLASQQLALLGKDLDQERQLRLDGDKANGQVVDKLNREIAELRDRLGPSPVNVQARSTVQSVWRPALPATETVIYHYPPPIQWGAPIPASTLTTVPGVMVGGYSGR